MFVSVLTLCFDPTRGVFDQEPLRVFCRDKVVLDVREHFFVQGSTPHLALLLTYRLVQPSAPDGSCGRLGRRRPTADDLRADLPQERRELFDQLRDWRNETSREDGVPAYAVLTNKQLLALAEGAPKTRQALQRVQGLGKRKAARYGEAILAISTGAGATAGREPEPVPAEAKT